jgi:hypothetical protein
MSGILVIGEPEQRNIARAIKLARKKPKPWAAFKEIAVASDRDRLMLKDRRPGIDTDKVLRTYPSQQVMLGTYRAQFSFEEQPAGLFRHLSVSSQATAKVPGDAVMAMVTEAFGFSGWPPTRPGHIWAEEFEPGRMAINVVEMERSIDSHE